MIPEDPPQPKSVLDSFADKVVPKDFMEQRRNAVYKMVDQALAEDFKSMESWEEWHAHLAAMGIIPAKSCRQGFTEEKWYKWASRKGLVVRPSPAQKNQEWMLVPEATIEKMIVLGRIRSEP